jgi:hypothetical protein
MSVRAERYRKKAAHCQQAAGQVSDPATKTLFLDLAQQWRELAQQVETLERERGEE